MDEAYTQVGTDVTRGARLAAVIDMPSAAATMMVVRGASVSPVVRPHWPQQAGLPTYTLPSANRFELSQKELHPLRLTLAAD